MKEEYYGEGHISSSPARFLEKILLKQGLNPEEHTSSFFTNAMKRNWMKKWGVLNLQECSDSSDDNMEEEENAEDEEEDGVNQEKNTEDAGLITNS